MLSHVKFVVLAAALTLAAFGQADRLILAPTGKKIPLGVVRLDYLMDGADHSRDLTYVGLGLTTYFDAEIGFDRFHQTESRLVLNASFNLVDPVVNLTPGISFGVQDALRGSTRGRRFFGALTWRNGLDGQFNFDTPMEASFGVVFGDRNGFVVGVMLPFAWFFRGLVEYDVKELTAGLEVRPMRAIAIRWLHRQHRTFWSLTLTHRY